MMSALWFLLALAVLAGARPAQAQATVGQVPVSKVIDLIGTAQRRVLVYVPYLTDPRLADALRAARNDPARPELVIIVITVPFFAAKDDALTNGLTLAGVSVVEAQVASTTAYALVDNRLFSSTQLGRVPNVSTSLMSAQSTNTFLPWFKKAAKAGRFITAYTAFTRIGETK